MKLHTVLRTLVLTFSLTAAVGAFAIEIPGMKKGSDNAPTGNAVALQSELVNKFSSAWVLISEAREMLATAHGFKKEAAKLQAEIQQLSSGAVLSKDEIDKIVTHGAEFDEMIEELQNSEEPLSAEARAAYVKSIPVYLGGVVQAKDLLPMFMDYSSAAKDEIAGASMMNKRKITKQLGPGMYLAKNGPSLVGKLVVTGKQYITFANAHDIKVPNDATDLLAFSD